MKLRCFSCVNEGWARKGLILTLKDVQDLAIVHGLDPLKVQRCSGSQGLGFYYGRTLIAQARLLKGELRTDVAGASREKPILVLENGAVLGPDELDGYTIVHAKGSEMVWARGGPEMKGLTVFLIILIALFVMIAALRADGAGMDWLVFIFALECGLLPDTGFARYQPDLESVIDAVGFYTDLSASVESFGFYVGGGMRNYF